jgi:hypothetical protein
MLCDQIDCLNQADRSYRCATCDSYFCSQECLSAHVRRMIDNEDLISERATE